MFGKDLIQNFYIGLLCTIQRKLIYILFGISYQTHRYITVIYYHGFLSDQIVQDGVGID